MTTVQLIQCLQKCVKETILLNLQGIISAKLEIEKVQMTYEKGYLNFQEETNTSGCRNIGLNLHQLKKIYQIEENEFLLEFDQLQNVKITIK